MYQLDICIVRNTVKNVKVVVFASRFDSEKLLKKNISRLVENNNEKIFRTRCDFKRPTVDEQYSQK